MTRKTPIPRVPLATPTSGAIDRGLLNELAELRARVTMLEDELAGRGTAEQRKLSDELSLLSRMANGMTAEASGALLASSASLELALESMAEAGSPRAQVELVEEGLAAVRRCAAFMNDARRCVAKSSAPARAPVAHALQTVLVVTGVTADRRLELRYDIAPDLPEVSALDVVLGRCMADVLGRIAMRRAAHVRRAPVLLRAVRASTGVRLDIEPSTAHTRDGEGLGDVTSMIAPYADALARRGIEVVTADLPRTLSFILPR